MASHKLTRSPSNKVYYTTYKASNRRKINKEKKILRHLKKHPNDKQTLNSLK